MVGMTPTRSPTHQRRKLTAEAAAEPSSSGTATSSQETPPHAEVGRERRQQTFSPIEEQPTRHAAAEAAEEMQIRMIELMWGPPGSRVALPAIASAAPADSVEAEHADAASTDDEEQTEREQIVGLRV